MGTASELIAKLKKLEQDKEAIQALWRYLFRNFAAPDALQCHVWLNRHDLDTVVYGLEAAAACLNKKRQEFDQIESPTSEDEKLSEWTRPEIMKYASGAMFRKQERDR